MTAPAPDLQSSTRRPSHALSELINGLKPGQKLKITQTVRVGRHIWTTTVTGVFRGMNYLQTGLSAERAPDEEIVVATVHFTKENGELSSVALDEHTKIEVAA